MPDRGPAQPSDEALAARAAGGELAAFEALVNRYGGAVLRALERLGLDRHAAEDAAQDAWVKLFGALDQYHRDRAFRPWLFSIALNQGRDARRRATARARIGGEELGRVDVERTVLPNESALERDAIAYALAQLDEVFREAVVLVDVSGLDYDQAAVALGCAIGTVKSRVHRGREAFRAEYARAVDGGALRSVARLSGADE
ncbi:MAG: sigma-70 family RNA polymerase sigma factor [Planctomycetota bacterium]